MTVSSSSYTAASSSTAPNSAPIKGSRWALFGLNISLVICAVIVLGLVANVTSKLTGYICVDYTYDLYDGFECDFYERFEVPSVWAFNLFAGAWGCLVGIYLIVASIVLKAHQAVLVIVLGSLNVAIWFVAFILMAIFLGVNLDGVSPSGNTFAEQLTAAAVFAAFAWVVSIPALVLNSINLSKSRRRTRATPSQQYISQQAAVAQHPGSA